jgi:hypothetical protein
MIFKKLEHPIRDAIQRLEQLAWVRSTLRTDSPELWAITNSGSEALARGEDALRTALTAAAEGLKTSASGIDPGQGAP